MAEADINGFLREVRSRHVRAEANILYRMDPQNTDGVPYADLVQKVQDHCPTARIGHVSEEDEGMTVSYLLTEQTAGAAFLKRRFEVESGVPDAGPMAVTLTAESFGLDIGRYLAEIVPNGRGWKLRVAGNKGAVPEAKPRDGTFVVDLEEPVTAQPLTAEEETVLKIGRRYNFETEQPAAA